MNADALKLIRAAEPAERLLAEALEGGECAQNMESTYFELVQSRAALARAVEQFFHATGRAEFWLRCVLCHEGVPRVFERAYYELSLARREVGREISPAACREAPLPAEALEEDEELSLWHPGYFDGGRQRRGSGRPMR